MLPEGGRIHEVDLGPLLTRLSESLDFAKGATAPMIRECPVNMELKLHDVLDFPTHDIFIGELIDTYADATVLDGDKIDVTRLRPLLFEMAGTQYFGLGAALGRCWHVGKSLKRR